MAELRLTLTDQERQTLMDILKVVLKQMQIEEHRTRTPSFREHVIQQEDAIKAVLDKLRQLSA